MSKSILQVLVDENITKSFGEGRRLIANGAVTANGNRILGFDLILGTGKHEIKIGKKTITKEIE